MTRDTQFSKAELFKSLHDEIFIVPNPWDAGAAKMLDGLGFKALATTSAGVAFSLGKPDGDGVLTRQETIDNVAVIAKAVNLPVAADLENGYGDDPQTCAETILLAANAGAIGGSIEDSTGNSKDPIYPFELAVERIKAAVKAARGLPFPFTLTARAENLINGRHDLQDTIRRLQAYAEAGADVLFAPGLTTSAEIEAIVNSVRPKPVNVVMGLGSGKFSIAELKALGVKRVSLGSSLARAAYGSFLTASKEILHEGTFGFSAIAPSYGAINEMLRSVK